MVNVGGGRNVSKQTSFLILIPFNFENAIWFLWISSFLSVISVNTQHKAGMYCELNNVIVSLSSALVCTMPQIIMRRISQWLSIMYHVLTLVNRFNSYSNAAMLVLYDQIDKLVLKIFYLFFKSYVYECIACRCTFVVQCPWRTEDDIKFSWKWNCGWLLASIWVLGIDPKSIARAAHVFNHWVISPVSKFTNS